MAEISNLGYVVLNVSDLAAWRHFACDIIGMMAGPDTPGRLALRMDDHAYRLLLLEEGSDDIAVAGWQFDTGADLAEFVENVRRNGVAVREGGAALAAERGVEALFVCDDPSGFQHEFFYGATHAPISRPFRSPVMRGAGFVTGRQGLGHILPYAKDYQQSIDFYTRVLGLRVSDYIRDTETLPGISVDATFFHTRTGRHHSLASAFAPSEKCLNHIMVEVQDLNDVGLAYDRCVKAGLEINMGIGHHPNDQVISFYVRSPSGFAFEVGYGSIVIDDATWEVKNYSQMSDWGHSREQIASFD